MDSSSSKSKQIHDNSRIIVPEPLDHWHFLDEIEAPMWFDLSLCDSKNNDEILYAEFRCYYLFCCSDDDDSWFEISHEFHQCSSSHLISKIFHPKSSISIQEPPSPKIPSSVSKSRGKSYKLKEWEQRKCKAASNKQQPVKTLTRKAYESRGSSNMTKTVTTVKKLKGNEGPKASSSCESGLTNNSKSKVSITSLSSVTRQEQHNESSSRSTITSDNSGQNEKKSLESSCQTSSQTGGLLASLRVNLRKSCATRPAARVVANGGRSSVGCKSSSSKSSVGSTLDQGSNSKSSIPGNVQKSIMGVSRPLKDKAKVQNPTKPSALNVQSSSNRQVNKSLTSKVTANGKVQQHTLHRKALIPLKVNEQNQTINRVTKKVGIGRRTTSLPGIKETALASTITCEKPKSIDKTVKSVANIHRASKPIAAQKRDSKKLIDQKEKTNNRSRDKDTVKPAQKVYFR
uniref:uncharacterized protein LOC122601576 n=1 Tax=Erigeron canadensis TaxID=72917 RepID=UPI001CB97BAF|nr:uncharacterized protein LOC122601576 [Erigeron canadensis]